MDDDDSTTLSIPELEEIPSIDLGDLDSLVSMENVSGDSPSEEVDNANIAKIHEYLDRDLVDQDSLIEKLKAFEEKLDSYMNRLKVHRT
ncbi:ECU06_0415 [Encephalitozoon cuniculi GB-M1]|uniref:ECU06_0415 protein n=1 Tax=Encephalitozoon cuniculi (strain GB-M1) TaxID=284813 RepID=I7L4F8_ENCCU|nr:uncharacterized protein ECU06_0415 [Encephalitozoon cuniculi GB-M1]UYI27629.1 hypothetical protein J0A71_07g15070 [Encephalitozoon cuniculi]CCI73940.1 ECU06_0415 [Encephalitozoon cuniculi GB-M1]